MKPVHSAFPSTRMRRMRRDDFSRRLMREHRLSADDLIYPVFVLEGEQINQPVASMPGVSRVSLDNLLRVAEEAVALGVPALALFPVVEDGKKSLGAEEAYNPDGLVPRVVQALKAQARERGVQRTALVSVQGSRLYWERQGYVVESVTNAAQQQHLASYGEGALYMVGFI